MKWLSLILIFTVCCGCATTVKPPSTTQPALAFIPTSNNSLAAKFAPIITSENSFARFNKIGTAKAQLKERDELVYIDPDHASFYFMQRKFTSVNGKPYTNLIYRIHFEEVPHSLIPFHLTAGNNGGLIIVITLNQKLQPVLITTVHSCGCYLGFIPTSFLAKDAFPENWNWQKNPVYGEELPAVRKLTAPFSDSYRPLIQLRNGTHRVKDIHAIALSQAKKNYSLIQSELVSMNALKTLPLGENSSTSFFHEQGLQKGYVKGATKPYELLLMSWWTFDLFVGRDKDYGPHEETGTVFYTSLKPWRRKASDMWPFGQFLSYWGWEL